ncbi:MAG TPA: alpha-ketoglutarate-dependent dioxygenase AlkB [Actinomycetota bacterium]|jgi:alkylated DNA repair dioxygenase AlkB|nr:alpha-ketoglutarate-dependent dioxygenase AlkB [Actinomycetota bacterium]
MARFAGGFQASLFDSGRVSFDASFGALERLHLDERSWVDHQLGWVEGSDRLFGEVLESREWAQRRRHMYDKKVVEPRLVSPWFLDSGEPLLPPILEDMRLALSDRYDVAFDSVGFNLYRDGRDGVAWHGDRIEKRIEEPVVALVSLGEPRKFLLRPAGGGSSRAFLLGRGDLLVTGGRTQRDWEHSVPKVSRAGPRISLAFRHGMSRAAYAAKETVPPQR